MIYKIAGGIFLLLLGISLVGVTVIPSLITGIFGIVAGIALLSGI